MILFNNRIYVNICENISSSQIFANVLAMLKFVLEFLQIFSLVDVLFYIAHMVCYLCGECRTMSSKEN